jgi:PA14 domain
MRLRRLAAPTLALALGVALSVGLASADDPATGLKGEYFASPDLTGAPSVTQLDGAVDFDWGLAEPFSGAGDDFSVRWTGTITPRYSERYTLSVRSDDGVRLYVDGAIVIDDFTRHAATTRHADVDLTAGRKHEIELEYHDAVRLASVTLEWKSASQPREVVPRERLAPPASAIPPPPAPAAPVDKEAVAPGTPATTVAVAPPAARKPGATATGPDAGIVAGPLAPPAPPVAGETFNAEPSGGEVLVRRPGDGGLIPLEDGASLPVGTRVDSREGSVVLETAPAAGVTAPQQQAAFGGATFRVSQPRDGEKIVTVDLMHGSFETCVTLQRTFKRGKARAAGSTKARRKAAKRIVRRLWGSGKGRFRTRGRHAAATVRGTEWTVEDRCDATAVRVRSGVVDVEDFGTGKTVAVRAGEVHIARPVRR